ncbi:MAG TPA: hypothetical protein DDW52_00750 [Planctomycetaceae bacterium]|nr:hypothetical protein [Planctomycetaceae bacterium]
MTQPLRIGISTCPNDTFAFHGLLTGVVPTEGLELQIELMDISELNSGLIAGRFDVAKASFHAALLLADQWCVLPSGSALGFGVGPLLLAARPDESPTASSLILCPGELTTATLLMKLFYREASRIKQVVFSDIMPELKKRNADFGVCIHEGRFTWEQEGVHLVEDLGARWEQQTGAPLPLGGILGAKRVGTETLTRVQELIAKSLAVSLEDPSSALPTMRAYAQEFDDDVLMQHVDLYVNEWTQDLGDVGRDALQRLSELATQGGITAGGLAALEVL